jgi:hypothetical protein
MDWGQEMRCKENAATSQKLTALIAVTAVRDGLYRAGLATNEDLKALIAAAPAFQGPGILVPTRNAGLFRWCLENGLRVVQPMTLMTVELYNEPAGAYLPSILF